MPPAFRTPARSPRLLQRLALGGEGPGDPNAYAAVEVRMDAALARIARAREVHGERLTVTHLVAKAAADALRRHPESNVLLRFGRPWLRTRPGASSSGTRV